MNAPLKITGTVGVWLTPYVSAHRLEDLIIKGEQDQIVNSVNLAAHDMSHCGWTRIGEAEVTLTLAPVDERMASAIAMLRAQLAKERAESQQRQNAILDQISKLQAITYEAPESAPSH